jgi:hypothetical protein
VSRIRPKGIFMDAAVHAKKLSIQLIRIKSNFLKENAKISGLSLRLRLPLVKPEGVPVGCRRCPEQETGLPIPVFWHEKSAKFESNIMVNFVFTN